MKVYVVIKRCAYRSGGDSLETLGVFTNIEDAQKKMADDFRSEDRVKESCERYTVTSNFIYVVGRSGFSCDHYWAEIHEMEVK